MFSFKTKLLKNIWTLMEKTNKKCGYAEHNSISIKFLHQHLWCIPPLCVYLFNIKFSRDPVPYLSCIFSVVTDIVKHLIPTCQNPIMLLTYEVVLKTSSSLPNLSIIWDSSVVFVWTLHSFPGHIIKIRPLKYSVQSR